MTEHAINKNQEMKETQNQGFTEVELETQAREVEAIKRGKQIAVADIIKEIDALKLDMEQIKHMKAQVNSELERLNNLEEKNDHKLMTLQNTALKIITGGF